MLNFMRKPIFGPSLQELLLSVLVTLLALEVGFFIGQAHPKPQYVIDSLSQFELNKRATWNHFALALSTLANCADFKERNPAEYRKFQTYLRGKQRIGYDAGLAPDYYAYASPLTRTIWLGPAYFQQIPEEMVRTLAHESLHLSGFPDHTVKKGITLYKTDRLYQQTDFCFPNLPKEAL